MTITPAQENERMLARMLGIGEDHAALRLAQTVAITVGNGSARLFADELAAQLGRTVRIVDAGRPANLEVVINAAAEGGSAKRLFITINKDEVTISDEPSAETRDAAVLHGVQRMIGACYAASVVLARLVGEISQATPIDPFVVRFGQLGATCDVLDTLITIKDTVLAGAGAVGNGFLRAARHLDIRGELTIADPKTVGSGNPNRCLYFTEADVGEPKAERLCLNAQPDFPNLRLTAFIGTFADVVKARGKVRRAIIGADSRRARRSIQKDLPLEVIDASTTGASEVIVHSHRQPNADACLACIYPHVPDELARERDIASGLGVDLAVVTSGVLIDKGIAKIIASKHPELDETALVGKAFDSLFKQLCGEQVLLSATGEQVLAPFAFVSNLAGALLALELARFESGRRFEDGTNYLFASPWAPPHARLRRHRGRVANCEFCGQATAQTVLAAVWPGWGK